MPKICNKAVYVLLKMCLQYVQNVIKIIDYGVVSPDINFSDHLPLAVVMKGSVYDSIHKQKCDSKSIQLQLRWDKGDLISFYQFTYFLTPLLAEVKKNLKNVIVM